MVREIGYGISSTDFCHLMVVGTVRAENNSFETRNAIRANLSYPFRIEGPSVRKKEWLMSLRKWIFGDHKKADRAIALADEVTQLVRNRESDRDPFIAIVSDVFFHKHDIALIADAYEIAQESRIYRGHESLGN